MDAANVNQLSSQLLELLACPAPHHAPLVLANGTEGDQVLRCTQCNRMFPIVDGIPVLLLDEAIDPDPCD